jgi:hypothetical protein
MRRRSRLWDTMSRLIYLILKTCVLCIPSLMIVGVKDTLIIVGIGTVLRLAFDGLESMYYGSGKVPK